MSLRRPFRLRPWACASTAMLTFAGLWDDAWVRASEPKSAATPLVARLPRTRELDDRSASSLERLPSTTSQRLPPVAISSATASANSSPSPVPVDLSAHFPVSAPEPAPAEPQWYVIRETATPALDLTMPLVQREPVNEVDESAAQAPPAPTWPDVGPVTAWDDPVEVSLPTTAVSRVTLEVPRQIRRATVKPAAPPEPDPLTLLSELAPTDWRDPASCLPAAADQAGQGVARASHRASRGAIYSATQELEQSLTVLAEALDRQTGSAAHLRCLRLGFLALEEAADFSVERSLERTGEDWSDVLLRHRSRAVNPEEGANLTGRELARRYYAYAQDHLAAAVAGSKIGAHAFYGLGKVKVGMSQSDAELERVQGPRAMALHQTALAVDPSHSLAANELGVLLARVGRVADAREAFRYALSVGNAPEAWRNLAQVHQRLGEQDLARMAQWEWQRLAQANPQIASSASSMVRWVDRATFEGAQPNVVPTPGPAPAVPAPIPHTALQSPNQVHARW